LKLTIENFQSHKHTELDLVDGVNVITGLSDVGKSAVLRAINWLVNNTPSGEEFYSHWGGNTQVSFQLGDTTISRTKGKGINEYSLQIGDNDPQVFTGFGQGVPEPIKEALNIQDVNLRFQHQGAFLLSESSGEVSRYLNRVARLEVIDTAISNIEKQLKSEQRAKQAEQITIERLTEELKQFDFLVTAEKELKVLETKQSALDDLLVNYNTLFDIHEGIKEVQSKFEPYERILQAEPEVVALLQEVDKVNTFKRNNTRLGQLQYAIIDMEQQIEDKSSIIPAMEEVDDLVKQENQMSHTRSERNDLREMMNTIKKTTSLLSMKQKDLDVKHVEFSELMPEECPLCGGICETN